jgi:hypothetical protein
MCQALFAVEVVGDRVPEDGFHLDQLLLIQGHLADDQHLPSLKGD